MYKVVQSCVDNSYSLSKLISNLDYSTIIVINNSKTDSIEHKNNITYIHTTDNSYELSAFKQIYNHLSFFNKYDQFLFLHDTIEFGPQFEHKLTQAQTLLSSRKFDWAPLSYNFQCMMGIGHIDFVKDKFGIYNSLPNISKRDAIDIEWYKGQYADYSLHNLAKYPAPLGRNPKVINKQTDFLHYKNRTKIYFESLDLYKYYNHPKKFL